MNLAVLHVPTIKPLDEATILQRGAPQRAAGGRGGEPHHHRRPGRGGRRGAAARRRARRSSGRSRCRTSSWTPAPCRRCTTATASRPAPWPPASRAGSSACPTAVPGRRAGHGDTDLRSGRHRMTMQITRRHLLAGTAAVLAAPAVLRRRAMAATTLTLGHGAAPGNPRSGRGGGVRQACRGEDRGARDGEHRRLRAARQRRRHADQPAHGGARHHRQQPGRCLGPGPRAGDARAAVPVRGQRRGLPACSTARSAPSWRRSSRRSASMPLGWWDNGIRHITNSKKPINTPADLQGLTIRTPADPMTIDIFQALGARPSRSPSASSTSRCSRAWSTARRTRSPTSPAPSSTRSTSSSASRATSGSATPS